MRILRWRWRERAYRREREGFFQALRHLSRREFLRVMGEVGAWAAAQGAWWHTFQLVDIVVGKQRPRFRLAYITDTHLFRPQMNERFLRAALRAVEDLNRLEPPPDFVVMGGDLAHGGEQAELELGREILKQVKAPVKMVVGEHDWYLDLGEAWQQMFGSPNYSFDHRGVHFIVLMSVGMRDFWTERRMTPQERMRAVGQLDHPETSRFEVGEQGRRWLAEDLAKVPREQPVVVLTHAPLYKYYRRWNFWIEDAEQVQALLAPYRAVTVLHGHTHQVVTHRIGTIHFHGMLATAWPWPYAPEGLPPLTVQMDRVDPFDELDGVGIGALDLYADGYGDKQYLFFRREPLRIARAYLQSWGREAIPPAPEFPWY